MAIATCAELPNLDEEGSALLSALESLGIVGEAAVWDESGVDWSAYELVLIRSTWDYAARRDEFVAWAQGLSHVANPASLLRWNTDKRYLADLSSAGVPTVATVFVDPGDRPELPHWSEYVIKPTISAGSADAARWRRGVDDEAALAHLRGLMSAGRTAMIQPYLAAVDTAGESALVYLGGDFSHSIRKSPILTAGVPPTPLSFEDDDPRGQISPRSATAAELAVAARVLDAVPGGAGQLLYARVDLLAGSDGEPVLLELELTEPSLYLRTAPGSARRFAKVIADALGGARRTEG